MSRSNMAEEEEWMDVGEEGMEVGERAGEVRRCWDSLCDGSFVDIVVQMETTNENHTAKAALKQHVIGFEGVYI